MSLSLTFFSCHCFYSHIHCLLLIFPCVWQQHLRVIQIPTLPTLTHLETLQFHPIRAHHLPQSPFHQVPPSLPLSPPSYPHVCTLTTVFLYSSLTCCVLWASLLYAGMHSGCSRFLLVFVTVAMVISDEQLYLLYCFLVCLEAI